MIRYAVQLKTRFDGLVIATCPDLPGVPVSAADLSTVYRLGDGTLSPLTGPMNQDVYERVLDTKTIEHNGKKLAWTIPLAPVYPHTLCSQSLLALSSSTNMVHSARALMSRPRTFSKRRESSPCN